ncbi:MAG: Pr6Pr family membrane protein [Cyclobacteriaceae bacterium]
MKSAIKSWLPVIGFIAGAYSVISQWIIIVLKPGNENSFLTETVRYYSYMTVWTNILVALCFGAVSVFTAARWADFFRRKIVQTGTAVYIIIVGFAYHFLLSATFNPTGLEWFGNLLLHYINPVLYILFWWIVVEKHKNTYSLAWRWLVFPVAYFIYSLIRGLITGWYPYFFVDVSTLGYPQVMLVSAGLLTFYALTGLLLVFLNSKKATA